MLDPVPRLLWATVLLVQCCVAIQIPYIKGKAVATIDQVAEKDVFEFKANLAAALGKDDVLPVLCDKDGKALQIYEEGSKVAKFGRNPEVYRLIFVTYNSTLPFIIGRGMSYADLKPHVAARFNKTYAKTDGYVKLDDSRISFAKVLQEQETIPEAKTLPCQQGMSCEFKPANYDSYRLIVITKLDAVKTPPKLNLVTGDSVDVVVAKNKTVEIPDVDKNMTVGAFRSLIEVKLGLGSTEPFTLAICKGKDEAANSDRLGDVLGRDRLIEPKFVKFVDWSSGKGKSVSVSVCPNTTYIQAVKRGLPATYKLITVEQDSIPAVYKLTKAELDAKHDHLQAESLIPLMNTLEPLIDDEAYYVLKRGSRLLMAAGSFTYLPDGLKSTLHETRGLMEKSLGHTRAWLHPLCVDEKEIDPGVTLSTAAHRDTFLKLLMDPNNSARPYAKSVMVIFANNPKDTKEYSFQLCKQSTLEDLAVRILGLLQLSADNKITFFSVNIGKVAEKQLNPRTRLVYDPGYLKERLIATVNLTDLPHLQLKQPALSRYLTMSGPFTAQLTGGVGLRVENVDPKTTIGSFRKQLMDSNKPDVDHDNIRIFPFCVPDMPNNPHSGLEMDDSHTFASYDVSGDSFASDVIFSYKVGWLSNWVSGTEAKTIVGICPRSTYGQVVRRAIDPDRSLPPIRIVVEDEAVKGKQRRSFCVSEGRTVDATLVCSDPPTPKKDHSAIYVMPQDFSIVKVRDSMIPIGDPKVTPVKVLRDYFVNKSGSDAWRYAFCAPAEWMFWLAVEMDEHRSFAYYGFAPERWTAQAEASTVTVLLSVDGSSDSPIKMEYCPRSTVENLKYRLRMLAKVDPTAEVQLSGASFGFLSFVMWERTGDTSFMPDPLIARITSRSLVSFADITPTNKQKPMALLKSNIKVDGGGGGGGDDDSSPPTSGGVEKKDIALPALLEAELEDADVITFKSAAIK